MERGPNYEKALSQMQKYCAYQDRCHQEVRYKLIELKIYGEQLEEILSELIQEDFLNEERFARSFARGKFRIKQWGKVRITQELKQKGVSDYCIRKGLEEIDETEYLQTLELLIEKKANSITESDPFLKRKKIVDFLIRKGYELNAIRLTLDARR